MASTAITSSSHGSESSSSDAIASGVADASVCGQDAQASSRGAASARTARNSDSCAFPSSPAVSASASRISSSAYPRSYRRAASGSAGRGSSNTARAASRASGVELLPEASPRTAPRTPSFLSPAGANAAAVSMSTIGSFLALGANRRGSLASGTFRHSQSSAAFESSRDSVAAIAAATSASPNPKPRSFRAADSASAADADRASSVRASSKSSSSSSSASASGSASSSAPRNKPSTRFRFSSLMCSSCRSRALGFFARRSRSSASAAAFAARARSLASWSRNTCLYFAGSRRCSGRLLATLASAATAARCAASSLDAHGSSQKITTSLSGLYLSGSTTLHVHPVTPPACPPAAAGSSFMTYRGFFTSFFFEMYSCRIVLGSFVVARKTVA